VVFLGLIALRESFSNVLKGTIKAIIGFLILQGGVTILINGLVPFSNLFTAVFHLNGIVAEDNSLAAAVQPMLGTQTAYIMVFSFLINLLLARITKFKYIFLTGHMMFSFAAEMAIVLDIMGANVWQAILIGSVVEGVSMVLFPAFSQPFVRKVTGSDDIAFGFWGSSWISIWGWIGGKISSIFGKSGSSEEIEVPETLSFFKDMSIMMSIVMLLVYLVTAIFAKPSDLQQVIGGKSPFLTLILDALTFVAGILILLQGVRMFLAELIPSFKGIADKLIPNAKPALDVPVFYSYAPNAVTLGFLAAVIGGLIVTFMGKFLPVTVLPSVIGLFFMGGAAGVWGNAYGGKRGAIIGGFLLGFTWMLLVALAYPLADVTRYGVKGLWFATPDSIIVTIIMRLAGLLFGIPIK
jgi:PTS system ascorbate-specific IIC component